MRGCDGVGKYERERTGDADKQVELVEEAGLLHGYLENQLFQPGLERGKQIVWTRGAAAAGRPYLARAAEEHSGPHASWFWRGDLQGGGVLNDMMCHSIETARFLLTDPLKARSSLIPKKVTAQIACLKWQRPEYARRLMAAYGVDYEKSPSEDFARALVEYVDHAGEPLIVEAERARDERVVETADLVDAGVIFGTGFAPFRGGPLHFKASEHKEQAKLAAE